jgi:copper oxidase (laccase) domain-containing protein
MTLARDTYTESEYFFSHRRRTHEGEADTGRLMTIIGLDKSTKD